MRTAYGQEQLEYCESRKIVACYLFDAVRGCEAIFSLVKLQMQSKGLVILVNAVELYICFPRIAIDKSRQFRSSVLTDSRNILDRSVFVLIYRLGVGFCSSHTCVISGND